MICCQGMLCRSTAVLTYQFPLPEELSVRRMGQSLKLGLLSLRNEFKSGSNHSVPMITRMCNPTMLKCCRKKEQCMPARLDPCARDDGERMRCCMPAVKAVSILLNSVSLVAVLPELSWDR
ncbi:uncharacterized protein LOC131319653 [Rhododendron vialii]|uniref:uncharacterized protein LOC131319653 n=1 Tax=Rhododendron vialii TaxID=182163 RepID=UPI00265DAB02|nr:uncharacterized protein LOC131319653 [Rhododendron vialii]